MTTEQIVFGVIVLLCVAMLVILDDCDSKPRL